MSAEPQKEQKIFSPRGQPGWTQCDGTLKNGTQVMLASGGPMMTVVGMESDAVALCRWTNGYRDMTSRFAVPALWRKDE